MRSFHNEHDLKALAVSHLQESILAWEVEPGYAKSDSLPGQLVDCFADFPQGWSCVDFQKNFGLPQWLVLIYVAAFERLPSPVAKAWALSFLEAIPVGEELERTKNAFFADLISSDKVGIESFCHPDAEAFELVQTVVKIFRELGEKESGATEAPEKEKLLQRTESIEQRLREGDEVPFEKFLRIQRAMYALQWILLDSPAKALACVVSAHIKSLDFFTSSLIWLREGRAALVPNFETNFGGSGLSRRSEYDAFLTKFAEWAVAWLNSYFKNEAAAIESVRVFKDRIAINWRGHLQ